jgi:hypothetical protein
METICKVINLKPGHSSIDGTNRGAERESTTQRVLEIGLVNARNVLDTMEKEWEVDHSSVILREQFHLLRNYIEFLRRYHEGNL